MEFRNAIDIANRGLDHCGAEPITSFADSNKRAEICSRVYGKLRQAELRRNLWRFATKRAILRPVDTNTRLLSPALWVAGTTYFIGSIVSDEQGRPWISNTPSNLGNQPELSSTWEQYCGPLSVTLYDADLSYYAGELVYTTAGDGTYRVYVSLQSGNEDNPATATAWDATSVYVKNQVVTYSSVAYMSLIDFNTNQTPTSSPAAWAVGTTYGAGAAVRGSDGVKYTSIAGGNLGNDPVATVGFWTDTGILVPWATDFVGGTGSLKWLQIGGAEFPNGVALSPMPIVYPIGTGPSTQSETRNAFRLPANFLRQASPDPKAGLNTYHGAETGLVYTDYLLESDFIVSGQADPIMLRFVADMVDVSKMDPMFCEGLGARIGLEACEPITQSVSKKQIIASEYEKFMTEARLVNAIEIGTEEAPVDDYIACRW